MKKRTCMLFAAVMAASIMAGCTKTETAAPSQDSTEAAEEVKETAEISKEQEEILASWADDLYEPETKITYSSTIVWPADASAKEVSGQEIRPNTMIVAVNDKLEVSTLDGEAISSNLAEYLAEVKGTTLAALYVQDEAAAKALNEFAQKYSLADVFVAADFEHTDYVKEICDANVGVLGIIDWRKADVTTDRESLLNIIQNTNKSHAKIAIIPESIASYDAVEYMRSMLLTVWAETSPDEKAVYTQITNGVNGIVCSDYKGVASAIESFNDVTTLARHVFITGHRGMPSQYIENTIRSERGAIDAGANVLECDISMSSDGVIFVSHDDDAARLYNRPDVKNVEDLTIAELQAMTFDMTDDTPENAPNSVLNANNTNRTQERREDTVLTYDPEVDRIPTLREYLEALNDEDIFHFIEIKSYNPEIVKPFKELDEELGMTDRVCVITFNQGVDLWGGGTEYVEERDIMKEMHSEWPEMSLGYLAGGAGSFGDLDAIEKEQGIGAAVGAMYKVLQPYNTTCNDWNEEMFRNVIFAARHRGLTSWAWTYNTEEMFAEDYLMGGSYSLTTNFSSWATHLPVKVAAEDKTVSDGEKFVCPVYAQNGEEMKDIKGLSLVNVSGVEISLDENGCVKAPEAGEAVVMVRLDHDLDVNGVDLTDVVDTHYAIYSNPITITVK